MIPGGAPAEHHRAGGEVRSWSDFEHTHAGPVEIALGEKVDDLHRVVDRPIHVVRGERGGDRRTPAGCAVPCWRLPGSSRL